VWRDGIVTVIEPEVVVRWRVVGVWGKSEAGWSCSSMLMAPEVVVVERESWSSKVRVTLREVSLMTSPVNPEEK